MKSKTMINPIHEGTTIPVHMSGDYVVVDKLYDLAFEKFALKPSELKEKTYVIFKKRKSIKRFMQALAESESLEVNNLEQGRGKTKRIHPVLAIRYCSWLSAKFEVFIYHFFLENYPSLREIGGDYYNELRLVWLPQLFSEENLVGIIIEMNVYFKQKLKRTTDWNTGTKIDYCIRNHVFNNIITDIKLGEKHLSRELPINFLKRKIDYHINRHLAMVEIDKKIFGSSNQRRQNSLS
ncbi:KilA-N domain-containing protein [Candidatus Parabeggiatoa sp. HSG14]|uniref:KilA-N domain-containing protein n=1 Tax=Candidatus Parabeggiatoa sp. HSG14 TaxID=3055593 RepID=UPI0025A7C35A|nr:KilA-N domain-containing protein [Thiotrichales bacterium HSG14]